jgi:hypothetical protein
MFRVRIMAIVMAIVRFRFRVYIRFKVVLG